MARLSGLEEDTDNEHYLIKLPQNVSLCSLGYYLLRSKPEQASLRLHTSRSPRHDLINRLGEDASPSISRQTSSITCTLLHIYRSTLDGVDVCTLIKHARLLHQASTPLGAFPGTHTKPARVTSETSRLPCRATACRKSLTMGPWNATLSRSCAVYTIRTW